LGKKGPKMPKKGDGTGMEQEMEQEVEQGWNYKAIKAISYKR
jgi:hypothetical protein